MAQQTINVGAAPNDGTGTPLRTAFQYTNSNFTELYTALGGGSGLPGASGQLIFNNGTSLAGDNELFYNATTNTLTTEKLIVPGNTQVAGSASNLYVGSILNPTLFVNTNTNRVGIGTATPAVNLEIGDGTGTRTLKISGATNIFDIGFGSLRGGSTYGDVRLWTDRFRIYNAAGTQIIKNIDGTNGDETWYDGGGGTRMTLNSTGLGVGVASPTQKLHVKGVVNFEQISGGTNVWQVYTYTDGTYRLNYNGSGSDELIIDTSGNVGIKVEPSAWNSSYRGLQLGAGGAISAHTSTSLPWLVATSNSFINSAGDWKFINNGYSTRYLARGDDGTQSWWTSNNGSAGDTVAYTQAMTLDASGNLLVGTTASGGQNGFCVLRPLSASVVATTTETAHNFGALTGTTYATFLYATTVIGSITQNGTTGVLYNTTSDYRLKESVQPIANGLARVNALKPSIYKWKADGSSGEGFIAHELAEVVPAAVSGEKDAVNEDGSMKPQGVDMSRVVPILVAAIQELAARVQTLETR